MVGKRKTTEKAKTIGAFWRQSNPAISRIMHKTKGTSPNLLEHPKILLQGCMNYFNWADHSPHVESVIDFYKGDHYDTGREHMRAYTLEGLCAFIGVSLRAWRQGSAAEDLDNDVLTVMEWAENIIYEQTFSGAAAGLFKDSIVMRKLGLAEKSESSSNVTTQAQVSAKLAADEFTDMMLRMADRVSA